MKNLSKKNSLFISLLKNYIVFSISTMCIIVLAIAIGLVWVYRDVVKLNGHGFDLIEIEDEDSEYQNNQEYENIIEYDLDNQNLDNQDFLNDQNLDSFFKYIKKTMNNIFLLFIILYIFNIALFAFFLNKRINNPLKAIKTKIDSFDLNKDEIKLDNRWNLEFWDIANAFNLMVNKLEQAKKEKEILEKSKRKILADISHDIKTPITTINGYASAISEGYVSNPEEVKKYLNIISKKSIAVTNLIDILFEYATIEHPSFELDLKEYDICEFIREIVAENYEYIEDKEFELSFEIPQDSIMYEFDKKHLGRSISNIISNALRYNPPKTKIFIGLDQDDENIIIKVFDSGIGISKKIRDTIFEPFVTINESRTSSMGTGLGLSITKEIIQKHRGSIVLKDSDQEFRTKFEIYLPKA